MNKYEQIIQHSGLANATVSPYPVQVYGDTEKVSYGSGDDGYSGFKHSAVLHSDELFKETSDLHRPEKLENGIYWVVIQIHAKGKIKTSIHYVHDPVESIKANGRNDYKRPNIFEEIKNETSKEQVDNVPLASADIKKDIKK